MRRAPSTAKRDILVGIGVEFSLIALREELHEVGDHAQGLAEVVGDDVGELLQLGVDTLQIDGLTNEFGLGLLALSDVAGDLRRADDRAVRIPERRNGEGYVQQTPILGPAHGLEVVHMLALPQALQNHALFVLPILRQ